MVSPPAGPEAVAAPPRGSHVEPVERRPPCGHVAAGHRERAWHGEQVAADGFEVAPDWTIPEQCHSR